MKDVNCCRCGKLLFKRHDTHIIHSLKLICENCLQKETHTSMKQLMDGVK